MVHVGLDLCRSRVDVRVLDAAGETVAVLSASPDAAGLVSLVDRVARRVRGEPVAAVVESMTGARFVRDELVAAGWDVQIADAAKVKGLAPLACKTDRIDAWVLAELSRRDLVPPIWLPAMDVRADRERARFRLHLVKHRTALKNRIHSTLMTFGIPVGCSDLFGVAGRQVLAQLALPEPWATNVVCCLGLIDELGGQIAACETQLAQAKHRYLPRLQTAPGIGQILGFTIGAEIGDIARFPTPTKLVGYTGLTPAVYQSGTRDRRGNLTKTGPKYLRWALIEAAVHAAGHPLYQDRYRRTQQRLGKQRGPKIAKVQLARSLTEAIWYMLTRDEDFAPAGARHDLAA